jgi:hypothetical protein
VEERLAGRPRCEKSGQQAALELAGPGWSQAALSHIAVSKALLIIGMLVPKLALAAAFEPLLLGLVSLGATSVARSHDPISWERATEKNKNI